MKRTLKVCKNQIKIIIFIFQLLIRDPPRKHARIRLKLMRIPRRSNLDLDDNHIGNYNVSDCELPNI